MRWIGVRRARLLPTMKIQHGKESVQNMGKT